MASSLLAERLSWFRPGAGPSFILTTTGGTSGQNFRLFLRY